MQKNKSLLRQAIKTALFSMTVATAGQAFAESPPMYHLDIETHIFEQIDANGDGGIALEEYINLHTAHAIMGYERTFTLIDTDQDGVLTEKELIDFLPGRDAAQISKQFAEKAGDDAMMTSDEFVVLRLSEHGNNPDILWKFAESDQNRDQMLDVPEFLQVLITSPVVMDGPVSAIEPPVIMDGLVPDTEIKPPVIMDGMAPIELPEDMEKPIDENGIIVQPPVIMDGMIPMLPPGVIDETIDGNGTTIEPPVIMDGPAPNVKPPEDMEKPVDDSGITIEAPIIMDGVMPKPEVEVKPPEFVGPPLPPENEIAADPKEELMEKLAKTEAKIARFDKALALTMAKLEKADSSKLINRLERRLERLHGKLEKMHKQHAELVEKLQS